MAFFKKLKDRLFKSSSKLDEGLDAIIEEGGTEEISSDLEAVQDAPTEADTGPQVPEVLQSDAADVDAAIVDDIVPEPEPEPEHETETEPEEPKASILGRLLGRGDAKTVVKRTLDDDMLEQLEELLIQSDLHVATPM